MADKPISITFEGKAFTDPENARDFMEDLKRAIDRAISGAVEDEGRELTKRIINAFNNQSLPLRRLSPEYKNRKIKNGFDPRIGFYTGEMVKAIRFYKDSSKSFFIGIRRQRPSGRSRKGSSGLPIPEYARHFEFGTKKQPARPVFMPLLSAAKPRIMRAIEKNLKEAVTDVARVWGAK